MDYKLGNDIEFKFFYVLVLFKLVYSSKLVNLYVFGENLDYEIFCFLNV